MTRSARPPSWDSKKGRESIPQRDALAAETSVHAATLRRLLGAEPVDPASLSADTGLAVGAVVEALARLHTSRAIHLADGVVGAAYPLSGGATPHQVRHAGVTVYACCAIDALAVPSMVDEAATIESACAYCDKIIDVRMTGDRILAAKPDAAVVFHVSRDCCDAGPAAVTRCPQINFFCDVDHAMRWRAEHPRWAGETLCLTRAVARAREIFGSTIRLVHGEIGGQAEGRAGS